MTIQKEDSGIVVAGQRRRPPLLAAFGLFDPTQAELGWGTRKWAAMISRRLPPGEGGRHVHLRDDIAPAHAGVLRAEGDLAFLRGVRDDALLGAAEVVVEEVLEPHAGDEEEVPAVLAALLDVVHGSVRGDLAVVASGGAEALIELLQQIEDLEVGRGLAGLVVAKQCEANAKDGGELAAGRVVDLGDVLGE